MNLNEIKEMIQHDLTMDKTELDLESLKTPQLHNKYSKFHTKYKNLLKVAEQDLARITREKWEYYTGKADPSVYQEKPFNLKVLRQDVDKYIKSDPDVNKLEQKVTYIETTVDYLEKTLKLISNRTFTIKNAIDWKKFTSGVI